MTKIKSILAVGDSMTKGHGLKLEINDPKLWVNQIAANLKCTNVTNLSKSGYNNQWIFLETLTEIIRHKYDLVIVAWSAIPRFYFNVGLELYSTHTRFSYEHNINLNNNVTISKKKLGQIGDKLLELHNDHWDYLDLIKYVNSLIYIQRIINNKHIFFVNTLNKLPNTYFEEKEIKFPNELSDYEQSLLNVKGRDDKEILELYHHIHDQYRHYGGVREKYWLNLYDSFRYVHQIDFVSDNDQHPGYKSQDNFFNHLLPIIKNKLNETSTPNN